jgi:hypothetical protein
MAQLGGDETVGRGLVQLRLIQPGIFSKGDA